LVWNCFQLLLELKEQNKVKLIWVSGHSGVESNEKADQLAKLGADEPLLGPEPFCGITKETARRAIDLWAQSKARMAWKHTPGQRHAKKTINKSSNKLTSEPDEVGSGVVNRTLRPVKTPTQTGYIKKNQSAGNVVWGRKLPNTSSLNARP
jgi:hypothetical protein